MGDVNQNAFANLTSNVVETRGPGETFNFITEDKKS